MGARIRGHEWTATPLGSPATWPQPLRSALSICLNSSFPTAIYWGPQLRLLYNDAWAPVADEKHPWALGRPASEVWADIWDVIEPQLLQVITQARGFSTFDQMLPMQRGGRINETYWNYSFTPILDDDGRVAGVFNQGHETTAQILARREREALNATLEHRVADEVARRAEAEQTLRQVQKLEALSQLTGGIAHDFNNMLAVVIGGLNLLRRRLDRGETNLDDCINGAMDGALRAASLTQRLLAFARQQPLEPVLIDVNRMVADLTELLARTLGETINIQTNLAADLWHVRADRNQLENVMLNLAVNARDAMSHEGRLAIETANVCIDDEHARQLGMQPGEYVSIAVADNGSGMAPDVVVRAFDPFFTTKPVGTGTGLGLSQVLGFVTQSGGQVKIDSKVGHGTSIKVYLPRFEGSTDSSINIASTAARDGSIDEIILVVEDEPRVRAFSTEALRELGYTVIAAATAGEAQTLIENGQRVSLLFTDIVMPDMSGAQLAAHALRKQPHLKVVYTTGYSRDLTIQSGVPDSGGSFLPKPFTIEQLAARIRAALDGR